LGHAVELDGVLHARRIGVELSLFLLVDYQLFVVQTLMVP